MTVMVIRMLADGPGGLTKLAEAIDSELALAPVATRAQIGADADDRHRMLRTWPATVSVLAGALGT